MPTLIHMDNTPKAEQTRQQLMETAYRLFREKGYENVGIREIAAAVGVTTGSFYYHFKNKSDILNFRAEQNGRWMTEEFPKLVAGEKPLKKLEELLAVQLCRIFEEDGCELCECRMFSRYYKKRESEALKSVVIRFVEEGQADGSLNARVPAEEIARRLLVTARGVEYDWCIHQGGYPIGEQMREYIQMVLEHFKGHQS